MPIWRILICEVPLCTPTEEDNIPVKPTVRLSGSTTSTQSMNSAGGAADNARCEKYVGQNEEETASTIIWVKCAESNIHSE